MRQMLRAQTPDSQNACAALDRWLRERPTVRTLAVFSPLPGEVNLAASIDLQRDKKWVYPRVGTNLLTFHAVHDRAVDLVPGSFGILEPDPSLPAVEIEEIDVFICPGLAFDPRGGRLGRGRGFYDRILAHARNDAFKLGICFALQQVPDTFSEPHDVRMDEVIAG